MSSRTRKSAESVAPVPRTTSFSSDLKIQATELHYTERRFSLLSHLAVNICEQKCIGPRFLFYYIFENPENILHDVLSEFLMTTLFIF